MGSNSNNVDLPLAGMPKSNRDRLTFGVEFEFAIAVLPSGAVDPTPEDKRTIRSFDSSPNMTYEDSVLSHIAKTLTDAGIKSFARLDSPPQSPSQKALYTASENDVTVWRVEDDASIKFPKNLGFTFETLRNLYGTLWTFEPQIQTLHPCHRLKENKYCKNLRETSFMGLKTYRPGRSKWARGLEHLSYNTHTTEDLDRQVGTLGGRSAYNMDNIQELNKTPSKNTIEFRQYRATLNPEECANWARFCVGLLEFADEVEGERLGAFLDRHVDHTVEEFGFGEVLVALGMPYLVPHFEGVVAATKAKGNVFSKLV